jgi:hypothetical protein
LAEWPALFVESPHAILNHRTDPHDESREHGLPHERTFGGSAQPTALLQAAYLIGQIPEQRQVSRDAQEVLPHAGAPLGRMD